VKKTGEILGYGINTIHLFPLLYKMYY